MVDDTSVEWLQLRCDYLRESVGNGGADGDYVALARVLVKLHALEGRSEHLEEAVQVLEAARARHPASATVLEHLAALYAKTDRAELDEVLVALRRIDPSSTVVRAASNITQGDIEEWQAGVARTVQSLLDQVSSEDKSVAQAALAELRNWARAFPANSGYAVNLGFGLLAAGQHDAARMAALDAARIEDGSFADAYNIGVVLSRCGARASGRRYLDIAMGRALTDDERSLVVEALTQMEQR